MQDLVLIQDDVVIIQTSSSIYEDSRANFETDSGLKEALQKYPEQSFAQKFGLCNR